MRGDRALLPVFLGVAAAASPAARAFDLWGTGPLAGGTVQLNSDFEARYWHVPEKLEGFEDRNIHDYVEQVWRLNALVAKGGFTAGAQLDEVALFANRYVLDGQLYHSWQLYEPGVISPWQDALVHLEKLYAQQRWRHAEVTVGDFYASFGRGIVFNVVKNTDIDVDTSLTGARAVLSAGDLEFTALTGLSNTQLISQDQPNILIGPDPRHMATGLRLDAYGLGPVHAEAHGVAYRFGRADTEDRPATLRYFEPLDAVAGGASLEAPGVAGVDWYAEGDVFDYRASELTGGEAPLLGYAAYLSGAAYPGRTTVLVEAKRTRDTERINTFTTPEGWEIANVPTLEYERVITEDSSATVNSNDLWGARVRVDYAVEPGVLVPWASVAAFRDDDVEGSLHFNRSPETIGHALLGVQWFQAERNLQLTTGFREDRRDDPAEGADRMAHLDGELHVPVFGTEAIELTLSGKRFWWGNNVQGQADYLEMENSLSWYRGEKLIFVLYQDWTDNPLVRGEGNLGEHLYGAAEVIWRRTARSEFKAFVGAYKAGIRCSGGQCRSLPGFNGARVAWQTTL